MSDDSVREMLLLAERLRESHGGELDDSAILAVSEATGAPVDYVRLAVRLLPEKKEHGLLHRVRGVFLALEPDVRRHAISGLLAANSALMNVLAGTTGDPYSFYGTLMLITLGLGLWNISVSKDARTAAWSGALFGGVFFVAQSLFAFVTHATTRVGDSFLLIPHILIGAVAGLVLHKVVEKFRPSLGIKDPLQERQELLRQLVDLQERLKSGEQSLTFLSVDIVGSTRMKETADPLSVEFTFNEYHTFVEMITEKHGGRVHSTAGDGMTCAFDHPQQAYAAARNIQTGIIELNTFRNKIGTPLVLRCGLHTGTVVAPTAGDIKSVNFAHVIDIAAHLQKVCPPGGIAVSEPAASYLPGGPNGVGADRVEVMGVPGVIWMPRSTPSLPAPAPEV
jgi:class 3 adenylate cyclase